MNCYWPQGVNSLEKYNGLSESAVFAQNLCILQTRLDQMGKINFGSNTKMNATSSQSGKNRWKMGSFIYLSFLLAELRSFNCSKKCIICSFLLTSARNLSLLKQFTYMHLKVFITLFQKMIWFIGAEPLLMRY